MRPFYMLAALALGSCQWVPGTDQHLIQTAKAQAASELRDPASAQFTDLKVSAQTTGQKAVCGKINGKNAYGGYVGFREFYVLGDEVAFEPNVDTQSSIEETMLSYDWTAGYVRVCSLGGTKPQTESDRAGAT